MTNLPRYLAEFLGTFALVFIGVGAVYVEAASGGSLGVLGIALANGLTIMVMVYAFGHISGGHFNPAVTVPMWMARRLTIGQMAGYVTAQCAAAILAATLLANFFSPLVHVPTNVGVCAVAHTTLFNAVVIEAILTFLLVTVIWGSAVDSRAPKAAAGLAIGLTITLDILMGGYFTGAAMNPARALGPALVNGHWAQQAVYWVGPLIGGIAAGLLYESVFLKSKA